MGTRADFYIGYGKDAEWIGSIPWDGYPDGAPSSVVKATTEAEFRASVQQCFQENGPASTPETGWPWPWNDSHTTDFAYCFEGSQVRVFCFGSAYLGPDDDRGEPGEFPDMTDRQNVTYGPRSGLIVVRGRDE